MFTLVYSVDLFATYDSSSSSGMMYPIPRARFAITANLGLACGNKAVLKGGMAFAPSTSSTAGTALMLTNGLSLSNVLAHRTTSNSFNTNMFPNSPIMALPIALGVRNSRYSFSNADRASCYAFSCTKGIATSSLGLSLAGITLGGSTLSKAA